MLKISTLIGLPSYLAMQSQNAPHCGNENTLEGNCLRDKSASS